jgi:hypothetical protein
MNNNLVTYFKVKEYFVKDFFNLLKKIMYYHYVKNRKG